MATQDPRRPPAATDEHKILFQTYFKSLGPRTYAAQIKEANNGNHYLVLTEGKRDAQTGDLRKSRLFVYSEDFSAFFHMLQETAQFIKGHPVPEEVRKRRQRYWEKKQAQTDEPAPAKPSATSARASGARPAPASRPAAPRSRR
jgi:hypothetical protein